MVKSNGASVTFHVLDEKSYKQAKAQGVDLANPQRPSVQKEAETCEPKAKLCYLVKSKSGFGFSLSSFTSELQNFPEATDVQMTIHMLRFYNTYIFIIGIYIYEKSRLL